MSHYGAKLVVLASVLAYGLASARAADSGGYRGPTRNGVYPEKGLLKTWPEGGPKLLWKYDQLGPGWTSVTVANQTAYVLGGASPGRLFAFTLDGQLKFTKPYGPDFRKRFDGSRSTVDIKDGRAYFASGLGVVYCLDAATGETLWSVDTVVRFKNQVPGWGYNISPLVVDDKLVLPIRRGTNTMVALSLKTGETLWANEPSTWAIGDSSPVLVEDGKTRLIVNNLWNATIAVDPATGKVVWKHEGPSGTIVTPVYHEGRLFAAVGGKATMYKLRPDGQGFERLWEGSGFNGISQAVQLDGKVFLLANESRSVEYTETKGGKETKRTRTANVLCLQALDAATGRKVRSEAVQKEGSICAADGMVYLLEGGEGAWQQGEPAKTRISLFKPTADGFETAGAFFPVIGTKEAWVNPAIAEGRLWVRHGGLIAVYDIRAR